jgi:CheY-like chemotaxis protein/anti-sigma regulatory factor (Ser/Thr protein kinase)
VLIDDDERTRYVLGRTLRGAGYDVTEGASGEEAIRLVRALEPSCLVCDVHLPDVDGFAVCRWVRSQPETATMPVVLVSATRMEARDHVRGLESGADAYLVEPMESEVLVATVGSLLRARHIAERLRRLQEAAADLSRAATPTEVAAALLGHAMAVVGAGDGAIALVSADERELVFAAAEGAVARELAERTPTLPIHAPHAVCDALREGQAILLHLSPQRRQRLGADAPRALERGILLAHPILLGDRRLGVVVLMLDADRLEPEEADRALLPTLAGQAAQALERASLYERAQQRREAEERARVAAQFLGSVSATLDAVQGETGRAGALLDMLVPAIADRAAIVLGERDGPAHAVVTRQRDVEAAPPALDAPGAIALPLGSGAENVGRLLLWVSADSPLATHLLDPAFLEELARRGATSLHNGRLWQRARDISRELQHSLLPKDLPQVIGTAVAARYQGGVEGLDVGGDWYDAIDLPRGRLGVAVGDVVGRGLRAAAVMGQLRSGMSAMALSAEGPGDLLDRLEDFAGSVAGGDLATAVYAVLDPATGELRYAAAGHPPPLLLLPDGTTRFLEDGRSVPLCGFSVRPRPEASLIVPAGARLVLYTDGLVERRYEPLDDGLARLADAARAHRHLAIEPFCDALVASLADPVVSDDIALVCTELTPVPEHRIVLNMAPEADALAGLRGELRAWLRELAIDGQQAIDLLVAVGEACTNAVEHAYVGVDPLDITVDLQLAEGGLMVAHVRDGGRWRQQAMSSGRGRGIELIRHLVDRVDVISGRTGTRVTLEKRMQAGREPADAGLT